MQVRVHLKIYGKVQGVFFRKSAKIEADKLGVVGWVKNHDDGSVDIVTQGERSNVDKFIAWCRKGPPFAEVDNVEIEWKKNLEEFQEFSILD